MILTFKQRHSLPFAGLFDQARQVAHYAVLHKGEQKALSSKYVKHIGMPSAIANQILRKYGKNLKIKRASSVNLVVPGQAIRWNSEKKTIKIPCLKLEFAYQTHLSFTQIHQIEINKDFFYVSVDVPELEEYSPSYFLGIDLNTTGHCAVAACAATHTVLKLGKKARHIHLKYLRIRKRLQKAKRYQALQKIKKREHRIVKDLNHKISRKVVNVAFQDRLGIKMEDLESIRNTAKTNRQNAEWTCSLNSWSYYQLQQMIVYKAKLLGVPVLFIPPAYTSKCCSRCRHIGKRCQKQFECPICGHAAHADVNAAFNISDYNVEAWLQKVLWTGLNALWNLRLASRRKALRSGRDNDLSEGNTDLPHMALGSIS